MIRILLAEDQKMLLSAIGALLDLEGDLEVVGSAEDGESAKAMIEEKTPDLVVSDIEMPGLTGLELAEWLRDAHPGIRMLILTTFARPGYLRRAL
ncbi:MAG: response regulator, partial [Candidatus Wenzhouxiangella sp. M2_3B_020]